MLTALWRRLARWHPTYRKENHVSNSHLDSLLNLMPPIGCFVPGLRADWLGSCFIPSIEGALPFQAQPYQIMQNTHQEIDL